MRLAPIGGARGQSLGPQATGGSWEARLRLRFGRRAGKTRLLERAHRGPLQVQRAFYPEADGTAHVYVLHPPGGIVAGDRLEVEVEVGEGASALLTTPGATKAYRSEGAEASQGSVLRVEREGRLEWLPQEAIVFDRARLALSTRVTLAPEAAFLGWEIVGLGRPASTLPFEAGGLSLAFEVFEAGGTPRFIERGRLEAPGPLLDAAHGLFGHLAFGTLVATEPALELARAALGEGPPVAATLARGLLIVRGLDDDAGNLRRRFERVRRAIRAHLGRPPAEPAIWRT